MEGREANLLEGRMEENPNREEAESCFGELGNKSALFSEGDGTWGCPAERKGGKVRKYVGR